MTQDVINELNARQQEAVTAPLGPVLVLAGAGSGKTKVLTSRIAYLIQNKVFDSVNILALTFTNKAAGEMRERIAKILKFTKPNNQLDVTAGTFHSVCARILRHEIDELARGYGRNFVIYDSSDTQGLIKQIVIEKNLAERFKPQLFAYYISAAKNKLTEPQFLAIENDFVLELAQEIFEIYTERMREHNALDFDDLLTLSYQLFAGNQKILEKYQTKYKYVLVDEYQDTNHAQYAWLRLLTGAIDKKTARKSNIFVVGDDAQSIYGFRGANMQNILDFKKDYPGAKIIMLEQNYRSTQTILDAAGRVISLNPFQYEKNLWTDNGKGNKIAFYEANDEYDEGKWVIGRILNQEAMKPIQDPDLKANVAQAEPVYTPILDQYYGNNLYQKARELASRKFRYQMEWADAQIPSDLSEHVILYRTHAQSRVFEEMLVSVGMPYQIVGGLKFYERKEIKDMLSFLRLLSNPKDLVSLARIINVPVRGIGPGSFRQIREALSKFEYDFGRLALNMDQVDLATRAKHGGRDFFTFLEQAGDMAEEKNLGELMQFILNESGYAQMLKQDGEEGEGRLENILELINAASRFAGMSWKQALQNFLEEAALMADIDSAEVGGNRITLMTLHAAKGLEYNNVFLVGLEEGLLPHSRSLLSPQEIGEEIRLAYVGITRARKNLYLSYAKSRQSYGELKRSVPSRILKAIPKELIEKAITI